MPPILGKNRILGPPPTHTKGHGTRLWEAGVLWADVNRSHLTSSRNPQHPPQTYMSLCPV